ncbi:basal cell adhesion molecule [Discoglossus pictus]
MDFYLLLLSILPGCLLAFQVSVLPVFEVENNKRAVIPCTPQISKGAKYRLEWFTTDQNEELQRIMLYTDKTSQIEAGTEYSDKIETGNDFSLVIKKVRLSDERSFICRVTGDMEVSSEGKTALKVYDPPEIPELNIPSAILSVTESNAVEVGTCISRNAYPAPTIEWYKNQILLVTPTEQNKDLYVTSRTVTEASGLYTVSSILFLRPTKEDTDAVFSCKVAYPLPGGETSRMESREFNLTLHYYTENVKFQLLSEQPTKEGDTVIMRCVGDGYPPPAYIINKMQGDIPVELYSGADGVFTITDVSRDDNGTYRCQALDFDSPPEIILEHDLDINVHYLEELSLIPSEPITVSLGKDFHLSCSGEGSELPSLVWKKGERVVSKSSRYRLTGSTYADAGRYTCEATVATVPGLRKEKDIYITVEGKPHMETGKDMVEVAAVGDTVTLTCSAIGSPEPEITWTPETLEGSRFVSGMRVTSNVSVVVTSKLMNEVSCTAKNPHGSQDRKFKLVISSLVAPTTAPTKEQQSSSSTAVIAVVVCVLLLLLVVALFYFLQKKGKLTCGRSEKQALPQDPAAAELTDKSDRRNDQHGLLGSRGGGGLSEEC